MEYKVTEKDLIGQIEGFPIEVAKKMVERQVKQGNKTDISVFQKDNEANRYEKGFNWSETPEGVEFWDSVIHCGYFGVFFKKYPKQNQLTIEKDMAEYKEIKLDDNPSITAFQDYGLHFSKDLSTFAKTCINLPEGSSVNICNENGKVMIIVEPKQVKEEECRFKDGDILLLTDKNKNNYIAIFESYNDECITVHGWLDSENNVFLSAGNGFFKKGISSIRCATEYEILKFDEEFANQKHLRWNAEELKFEPIRWRAEKGGKYWFITSNGVIDYAIDNYKPTDNLYFNLRNYFETPEIANKALPLWKEFFKSLSL